MANGMFARIDTINFDLSSFSRKLADECRKMVREAAQKWLVAVIRRIPIRTGFLAGAFTPLENLVGSVNKATGRINTSRNPLLSREKKLDYLIKRKRRLESKLNQGDFVERARAQRTRTGKSSRMEDQREAVGEYQRHQRALRESEVIKGRISRIDQRIRKLLAIRNKTPGGKGQLEVMRMLEKLRREGNRLRAFGNAYNPVLREKLIKRIEKITQKKTVIQNEGLSNKERLAALRRGKRLQQQIKEIDEVIGKRTVFENKSVHVFREYYYHPGGKVLKTPRSGIQFATPEKDIFGEFSESESSKAKEVLSSFQQQIEATQRLLSQAGFARNLEKTGEDSGLSEQQLGKMQKQAMAQMRDAKVYFTFKFQVAIIYWGVNDLTGRSLKTTGNAILDTARQQAIPWMSLQAGNAAFGNYVKNALRSIKSLNNIEDFLLKRSVTFDGSEASASETRRVIRS